jgi:hypothetical protein
VLRKTWKGDWKQQKWNVAFAIEQPFSDATFAPGFETHFPAPDLVYHTGLAGDWGSFQFAGLHRLLGAKDSATEDIREYAHGWGINWTGSYKPWRNLTCTSTRKDVFTYSATIGDGFESYMEDTGGAGLDAVQDPATGQLTTLKGQGWWVAYTHHWTDKWATTGAWAETSVDLLPSQSNDTFQGSSYGVINLINQPYDRMMWGIEYLYGQRDNKDGRTGVANRITIASRVVF